MASKSPSSGEEDPASARGKGKKGTAPMSARGGKPSGSGAEESKESLSGDQLVRHLYSSQQEAERVRALEQSHETLLATCAELHRSLASMDDKHTSMFLFKQRETAKAMEHQKQLEATIDELKKQQSALLSSHKAEVASLSLAHAQTVSAMEDRLAVLQSKYDTLAVFQSEKAELESSLHKYRALLEQEKSHHALNVAELERRNVMEKDRLKNEMLRKIRETKLSLLSMTEDQLHTTTKRTLVENEQITTELQYQSRESEKIAKRNSRLTEENVRLKREVELAHSTQSLMAKKTMFYQNLIAKLQAKVEEVTAERERERQLYQHALKTQQAQGTGHGHGGATGRGNNHHHAQGGLGERAGAGHGSGGSSLSQLLRGGLGDESAQPPAPILPRTISGQSARDGGGGGGGGGGRKGEREPVPPHSSSRAALANTAAASGAASHAAEDAAALARLSERVASLERDKAAWVETHKNLTSQLRDAQEAHAAAEASVEDLENEVSELRQTVTRLRTHGAQDTQSALYFLSSCLQDQQLALSTVAEQAAAVEAEQEAATLAPVLADGSDATLVVRSTGERAVHGGAAAMQPRVGGTRPPSAVPTAAAAAAKPHSGVWDISQGYPASLSDFTPAQRLALLEHLLQQLNGFQRASPAALGIGPSSPPADRELPDLDRARSAHAIARSGSRQEQRKGHERAASSTRTQGQER